MVLFYVALFFGGAFFVNAIPHFVQGCAGNKFPSPFASPPGKGDSSPLVNVLWGTVNFAIAYVLLCQVALLNFQYYFHVLAAGAGGLLMALMHAHHFGKNRA